MKLKDHDTLLEQSILCINFSTRNFLNKHKENYFNINIQRLKTWTRVNNLYIEESVLLSNASVETRSVKL